MTQPTSPPSMRSVAVAVRDSGPDRDGIVARVLGLTTTRSETVVVGLVLGLIFAAIGIGPAMRDYVVKPGRVLRPVAASPADTADTLPQLPADAAFIQPPIDTAPIVADAGPPANAPAAAPYADGGPFGQMAAYATLAPGSAPAGLTVAPDGSVYAAVSDATGKAAPRVLRLAAASGAVGASWTIGTAPASLSGIALDGAGNVLVLAASPAAVIKLDPASGDERTFSSLPDLPVCVPVLVAAGCEPSPVDNPPRPTGIVVLADGAALVTDAGQATVWRVPANGGRAAIWHQSRDYIAANDASGLAAITSGAAGTVVLSVGKTAFGDGGVVGIATGSDGSAGAATQLYSAASGEVPAGITTDPAGAIYLALSGANTLLVLRPDGKVDTRLHAANPPNLATPDGVARRGGSVLVANRGGTPAVVRVSIRKAGA